MRLGLALSLSLSLSTKHVGKVIMLVYISIGHKEIIKITSGNRTPTLNYFYLSTQYCYKQVFYS